MILYMDVFFTGSGLTMKVIRTNQQCSRSEELKPVDQNLQYDFNFQQFTHFEDEFPILPVRDLLVGDDYMKHCFMGVQSLDKGVIGRGTWRIRGGKLSSNSVL